MRAGSALLIHTLGYDVVSCSFDNHTTHWESPTDARQKFLLEQLMLSLKEQDNMFEVCGLASVTEPESLS